MKMKKEIRRGVVGLEEKKMTLGLGLFDVLVSHFHGFFFFQEKKRKRVDPFMTRSRLA